MLEWVKANLHKRWSLKLLLYKAFIWVRDNLYSRWSFNLLIWHGFRMILRVIILAIFGELIISKIDKAFPIIAMALVCFLPLHIFIFAPSGIMFYLEKKRGIRISHKFLNNNKFFIPYLILSLPAAMAELLWILVAIVGILAPIPDMLANITKANPLENWFIIFSPDFYKILFSCFI